MHHTNRMKHFNYGLAIIALTLVLPATPADVAAQTPPLTPQSLTRDGVPPPDPAVSATLPRYLQSRSAAFVDWLLDGSMLITTRFGEVEQIHQLRAPLAMREQLTYAPGGVFAGAARPYASDALVYLTPLHGGDSSQLLLQRITTHETTALTDGSHRDQRPLWAHDGKRIAFASNRRNGVDVDVYVLDTTDAGATPQLVVGGAGNHWRVFDWSIDDKRLLLGRDAPPDSELYVAQVDGGELTAIVFATSSGSGSGSGKPVHGTGNAAPIQVHDARFATDGRGILVLSRFAAPGGVAGDAASGDGATGGPFQRLAYIDVGGHEWRELSTDDRHDVECFDRSVDGRYVAYTVNDAGSSRLMLIDQQRKLDLTVATLPPGVISNLAFDASGKRLALTLESIRSPRDVYVLEPETQALTRWTQSEVGPLDAQAFVAPQLLHYPTWDRVDGQPRMLTALVYRPLVAQAAPRAVLLLLCGGGGGQCRPGFDPFLQWLVNQLGVVVVAPNVRGSTGFGRALAAAGEGPLRDDAARDIGSLLVWIGLQRDLDRSRVALLGEGYGAYLALQSLADYGDRLRGAVVAFPPPLAGLTNGAAIRRPLLLVQGLQNPAVPAYALEQLRSRLRVDGVEVQYLAAADEGARFMRQSTDDAYHDAAGNFLAQLLR
jgi:predicted esterase